MSEILIIVLYIITAMIVFGALVYKYENHDDYDIPMLLLCSITWPLFLFFGIICLPFFITYKIATALRKYKHRKKIELTFKQ